MTNRESLDTALMLKHRSSFTVKEVFDLPAKKLLSEQAEETGLELTPA